MQVFALFILTSMDNNTSAKLLILGMFRERPRDKNANTHMENSYTACDNHTHA